MCGSGNLTYTRCAHHDAHNARQVLRRARKGALTPPCSALGLRGCASCFGQSFVQGALHPEKQACLLIVHLVRPFVTFSKSNTRLRLKKHTPALCFFKKLAFKKKLHATLIKKGKQHARTCTRCALLRSNNTHPEGM